MSFKVDKKGRRLEPKKLNILFVHPNFPGQFKQLISSLKQHANVCLAFITSKQDAQCDDVQIFTYSTPSEEAQVGHPYLRSLNRDMSGAQEVTKTAMALNSSGFVPAVIIGHIGWAGLMFIKNVFPDAKVIAYTEWFYKWQNSWEHFSGEPLNMHQKTSTQMLNATSLLGLENADVSVTPTQWQRSVFPKMHQRNMHVIHEGIDTQVCQSKERTSLVVPGCNLPKEAKIVTFISRSMEPARGFFSFMEAASKLCKLDPDIQFVVVGRPLSAYSASTGDGPSYKEQALKKYDCDWSRVHFCGKLRYEHYLQVLQNSSVHVHLSMPLFLSWSCLEAMACECAIVGSSNAPVNEVIEHDVNGRLVNFFDAQAIVAQVQELLGDRETSKRLGAAARQTVLSRYESNDCVSQWKDLILRQINEHYPELV